MLEFFHPWGLSFCLYFEHRRLPWGRSSEEAKWVRWIHLEKYKHTPFPERLLSQISIAFSSVQFSSLSRVRLFATPWIAAHQASLSITNSRNSLRLTSIESVMPSSHLMLCRPLLLLPPIPPSIRVFSNESTLHMRWPKYWSFRRQVSFNSLKCFSACVKKSPCGKFKKFKTKLY